MHQQPVHMRLFGKRRKASFCQQFCLAAWCHSVQDQGRPVLCAAAAIPLHLAESRQRAEAFMQGFLTLQFHCKVPHPRASLGQAKRIAEPIQQANCGQLCQLLKMQQTLQHATSTLAGNHAGHSGQACRGRVTCQDCWLSALTAAHALH